MTMDGQRFDRALPDVFVELANARTPDYLEAAIEQASSRPQRPSWTFPGRWIPMEITTKATPAARIPWRQIGILAILGVLLAIVAVAYVGSQRTRPAPFFGLAANGTIAIERNGDIFAVDRSTGMQTAIITGPEIDSEPVFTRDGTKIAFERTAAPGGGRLIMVANADGSGISEVTPEPFGNLLGWTFSPDGRFLLATNEGTNGPELVAMDVDGSNQPRRIDVELSDGGGAIEPPSYRPPDGREVVLLARPAGSATRGVYVLDPQTGETLRTIVEPTSDMDIHVAVWSPTGDEIIYGQFPVVGDGPRSRLFVVSADGTGARPFDDTPGIAYDAATSDRSNDGTRLVVNGSQAGTARIRIERVNGNAPPVELTCDMAGCPADLNIGNIDWIWSPDDSVLLGVLTPDDGSIVTYYLADPDTGQITPTGWEATGAVSWQRLAP